MLLQTNSYVVPREKRAEHARLMLRFRQCFKRLGAILEVYEQAGPNFTSEAGGRFVQIMRFRDRHHQAEVHEKEQKDPAAQQLIADFCQLLNISYQQQHGLFSANYYAGILPDRPSDKPELLVSGEAHDTIGELAEPAGALPEPAAEPASDAERDPTVEEAFRTFIEQPADEYPVHQQIDPLVDFDPEAPISPEHRHARHHRQPSPRAIPEP